MRIRLTLWLLALVPVLGIAKVKESGSDYFALEYSFEADVSREKVFESFANIGNWWEASHTFGGDPDKYAFDLNRMVLFESLDGGGVVHLEIRLWMPNEKVVLEGALGPLMDELVMGKMIWTFADTPSGLTKVTLSYRAKGEIGSWAAAVDHVLSVQVQGLSNYVNGLK